MLLAAAPALFVLLWSTGWISARAAAPYASPLTFLLIRFSLAAAALALLVAATGAKWPATRAAFGHSLVAGVLINALYLAGVWWAIGQGVPAGVSGVIAALQPILTALLAGTLAREHLSLHQWSGVTLGFIGIVYVLAPKLSETGAGSLEGLELPLAVNAMGMLAVTLGTFYQKHFVPSGDLRTMTLVQYIGAVAMMVPLVVLFETPRFEINLISVATMAWSVLALSIGGVGLYLMLIRTGAVSSAAALIYLVPATTALEAWAMFGEALQPVQIIGIVVTVIGVAMAVRR